ncbi:PLP-dependent aminotransferase family protein [Rhodococcus sp. D2-41]|uniref:MocR-like transcription factor YczR n=1 Tax=Speluncibacter jeojiensis TaxID=2710754 RepID=UPI00240EA87A|nr:PLP-dependent aminotransferase family protein [Rhodococcus sp. D2-41]MDG3010080.1 PLP-dependent aminotransferase family protein [Rhodococcus sp. D2-41]
MVARVVGATNLTRYLGDWRASGAGRGADPAYRLLADAVRMLINDGRIPTGVGLPSERDLSAALGVSRTTVTAAYAMLREAGYLQSRQGSRSTVALPASISSNGLMMHDSQDSVIDLSYAAMDGQDTAVCEAYAEAVRALPSYLATHGMSPAGLSVLREAVAARYRQRGVPTAAEQIMVTSGAQQAFRLILQLLAMPGERVLVEQPSYPNAIEAIRRSGLLPVPMRAGVGGWDLDALGAAARQSDARLAYLIPDFQNPTGACLGASDRHALVELAGRTRMTLVIDETMVEMGLDHGAPEPVAAHAHGLSRAEVITVGSASKSFWGGLRIGWIRADAGVITRLLGARMAMDLGTAVVDQLAAAHLVSGPQEPLDRRRDRLRARRRALLDALGEHLPGWECDPGPGGMSLWVRLPEPVSSKLAATAGRFGVRLAAGPRFGVEGALERFIRLPYTREESELREAVPSIAEAYRALGADAGTEPPSALVV